MNLQGIFFWGESRGMFKIHELGAAWKSFLFYNYTQRRTQDLSTMKARTTSFSMSIPVTNKVRRVIFKKYNDYNSKVQTSVFSNTIIFIGTNITSSHYPLIFELDAFSNFENGR